MRIGILLIKNLHSGGGIENYTYEVSKRLVQLGHEVIVYALRHYGVSDPVVEGIEIVSIPSIPGSATERLSGSFLAMLSALLRHPRPDILHLHTPMTGIFGVIPQFLGTPVVVQMHGVDWKRSRWGPIGRNVIRGLEAAVLRSNMICTAVSETQCAFYKKEYGRSMIMIPTGLTVQSPLSEIDELKSLGLQPDRFVLFASRFVQEKGAHYLIEAFRNLPTDFKLVVAGGSPNANRYSSSLLKLAGGDNRILFPGFVTGRLKAQLLANAAVFVLPSEIEGLSVALLEAMAYGRPIITSDIPENLEAVADAALTFRNRDVYDLQEKLGMLIGSSEMRDAHSMNSRLRLASLRSWDVITDSLVNLYEEVVTHNQAKQSKVPTSSS